MEYNFDLLLDNLFKQLNNSGKQKKNNIVIPKLKREPVRTHWMNLMEFCNEYKRDPLHVLKYICSEYETQYSWKNSKDYNEGVYFSPAIKDKKFISILDNYFMTYIKCKQCDSYYSTLVKDEKLFIFTCDSCKMSYSC